MFNGLDKVNVEKGIQNMIKEYTDRNPQIDYTYELIKQNFLSLSNNN